MYIPKHYKGTDSKEALSFMQKFNFAPIVSTSNNKPIATHLPFIISENDNGIILQSHLAKANPQAELLHQGENLIIFSEPHAYISPRHYLKKQNVPTWNYIAVHAYGKANILKGEEKAIQILETMIMSFEPEYKSQWDKLDSIYKKNMVKGIVAFEIQVSLLEFKEKLSQNKKEEERLSVINTLSKSFLGTEKELAAYMLKKENL